ncbi:Uma2 family endonuclease [Deinococcus planocerae]|uniref:Uma2 family endonuclease n=1 Tax=Deinococcus planocerae TaxID=1737569 RepID=UPI000C7F502A|nr:Uma2 family endonuclease [Deinococcus planocerae]
MSDLALRKISEEEYLRTEELSPYRREYIDGFVSALHGEDTPNAQAGATSRHGLICMNIGSALHRIALRQGCRLYQSDMRVRISQPRFTRYYSPDLVLTCDPVDDDATFLASPCLVAEVLSPSTRDLDRREKLFAYTALPSVQGYLLVDTATRAARLYVRNGEAWDEQYAEEGELRLPCLDVPLVLSDIYEGINL